MKCLIVEDDKISSQVLEKLMSRHGSVDTAVDGQRAVEMFRRAHEAKSPYDLILMDIMMPEVDGMLSVQTLREKETALQVRPAQRVKIIMTTALNDPLVMMKAIYKAGADAYLVKPIRSLKLEDELRDLKLIQ